MHTKKTKNSSLPKWVFETAPCLEESLYVDEAQELVKASLDLDKSTYCNIVKLITTYNLSFEFRYLEYDYTKDPIPYFKKILLKNAEFLKKSKKTQPPYPFFLEDKLSTSFEETTAKHYSGLFKEFDSDKYFKEPVELLKPRLERNGYDLNEFKDFVALDAGCGNGRYTTALKNLGMKEVYGIDLSKNNIADAKKRAQDHRMTNIHYKQCNVLKIEYDSDNFDFVFSNGVLHHTRDCQRGVSELLRVLKKGGKGFLKLMPNPGGIHWDFIEICRIILKDIPVDYCRQFYVMLAIPSNLIYLYLDHMLASINIRYNAKQIEEMLIKAGATNIKRLTRGNDIDYDERITNNEPYAFEKFGEGSNRFYFEK